MLLGVSMKKCEICGKPVESDHRSPRKKYCSKECYEIQRNRVKKEANVKRYRATHPKSCIRCKKDITFCDSKWQSRHRTELCDDCKLGIYSTIKSQRCVYCQQLTSKKFCSRVCMQKTWDLIKKIDYVLINKVITDG